MNSALLLPEIALPAGLSRIPVCIGDLPASDYRVSAGTITYDVVRYLRDHEEIPGVMIYAGDKLVSVMPRLRMFERLGQLYGTELFIRRPIETLCQNLRTEAFCLPQELRVEDAVQAALKRRPHYVYDPVARLAGDQTAHLIDMHTLLLIQSQILANLNTGISKLERVKRFLSQHVNLVDMTNLVIETLAEVLSYHQAAVFLHRRNALHLIAGHGFQILEARNSPDDQFLHSPIFSAMARLRQSMAIEDVDLVPGWKYFPRQEAIRCWMGAPLFAGRKVFGLISLGRTTRTPFRKDEKDTLDAYTHLLSDNLERRYLDETTNPPAVDFRLETVDLGVG